MIKAGIIGATGYTGAELVRILSRHPEVELVALTSRSYAGEGMAGVYPSLTGYTNLTCENLTPDEVMDRAEVIFIALPHGHAVPVATRARERGIKVIDLGADWRFRNAGTYEEWYKIQHGNHELAARAVYGLPEIHREAIRSAGLVANPGCYPTSAILGLAPLLKGGYIDPATIIIDAKSGVSGAGREARVTSLFVECNESINPYGVTSHRHTPEIEQELSALAGKEVKVTFTPHLLPISRGILSTMYATLVRPASTEELRGVYEEFYAGEPFVHLLPPGQWPHTRWVYGSNNCHLNLAVDTRTGRVVVASAIDNLTKGASGQAVQNLNLMCGFPETMALEVPGLCP
ncbi:N-acetyl-gamma-glutamyl-phosphate reductase [Moorella thermoacetica]|uniref:N-acetyl-gamma-glutamyl-phosphate reductase n=1 Tax=Neomoorella thermoacetica TaxID=1525 RepID=A0AAC9HJS8_NEOTH|nr:N-acetyl-gamma-glutamyl-phosphate reductase [Moorella thermoacetica]AOQ25264.1 N-acetyl-gamma-glutamyl-phosphate reductase [Moorella thermoacetica]TYL11801.1 N-acetyl-gamma-glutamyl-phosphate reductase [Moorella thermoacetica]